MMKKRKQRGGMSAAEFWATFRSPPALLAQPREVVAVAPRQSTAPIDPETLMPVCEACPLLATHKRDGSWLCDRCGREAQRHGA